MVEATVSLAEGQSLASYFANRKAYINLRGAHWASTGEDVAYAALRVTQVLWAAAPDGDIPLTAAVSSRARLVEVQLDGGLLIQGSLIMGDQQRLSDYLESAGQFLPMIGAQLLRSGRPPKKVNVNLGDVVFNQDAVQAVWEVEAQARATPVETPPPEVAAASDVPDMAEE